MAQFHIDDDRLYDKAEAAELAGYNTPWGINHARQNGKIAAVKRGREWKFPGWAIRQHNQGIAPNASPERDQTSASEGVA